MSWYKRFTPYVPVADRKRKAQKEVEKRKKKGEMCEPVVIEGRTIAHTFWGKAWCQHLGSYSDYSNRLPRGRSYVRQGAVIDLKLLPGEVSALVSGSSIYKVTIKTVKIGTEQWNTLVSKCIGKIDSLIELLQGQFSKAIMEIMTDPHQGLFPQPNEIEFKCSCFDWADMCKHVAAVLYGIGARLDEKPEELFTLREADHLDLITQASATSFTKTTREEDEQTLADEELSSLFGIDIDEPSYNNTMLSIPEKINVNEELKNNAPQRPVEIRTLDELRQYYWTTKELAYFCKQHHLSTQGLKADLLERITVYLSSGHRMDRKLVKQLGKRDSESQLTKRTRVRCYRNDEKTRAFFIKYLGNRFKFNAYLRQFTDPANIKPNMTYGDLITGWISFENNRKQIKQETVIPRQFEYNQFIKDYFAHEKKPTLKQAILCWNIIKTHKGRRTYRAFKGVL